ncbi:MAG TPA: class I SAM-dependent methyltransferase [Mycobacteriales bacterium]|nr:class I SAM-dependent methyltransferase [Mycobacteriales bacterium]
MPPGHYHSPVPALDEVPEDLFGPREDDMPGIDFRVDEQLKLASELAPYAAEIPFRDEAVDGLRYRLSNPFFYKTDGLVYYCLLRHWKPKRIVEVGSGWSTALALDTADRFSDVSPVLTAIDPNPERLRSLVRPGDRLEIVEAPVQTVDEKVFSQLEAGDILFIDSSHVTKIGSDVNRLFLEIVPRLPVGVRIHVHDMFYPEYPRQFVHGGMHWNEAYLVRALLTHSSRFRIVWWNAYLAATQLDEVAGRLPGWGNSPSSSLWLEVV